MAVAARFASDIFTLLRVLHVMLLLCEGAVNKGSSSISVTYKLLRGGVHQETKEVVAIQFPCVLWPRCGLGA